MAIDNGGPAFARPDVQFQNYDVEIGSPGMSLLDYFAGCVLTGPLAHEGLQMQDTQIAAEVYGIADAMVAEKRRREA